MVGARSAGTSTPFSAPALIRRSATSSPPSLRCSSTSIEAPISLSVVSKPVRSGLSITPSSTISEPGTISARDQRKRRRRRIGRHHDRRGFKLGLALQRDAAAVLAERRDAEARAEMLEHLFGVIAGRFLLDHRGRAGRREAREQHRRLELRGRHRRLVLDRHRVAGALHHRRQAAAVANLQGARAHPLQRIEDAPHRPRAQAGVAVERGRDRAAGDRAHGQPAAGAGIAEIERRGRLRKAADADAPHAPGPLAGPLHGRRRAPAWHWRC